MFGDFQRKNEAKLLKVLDVNVSEVVTIECKKSNGFLRFLYDSSNLRIRLTYYKVMNELYEHRGNARLVCMMDLRSSWKLLRGQSEASWRRLGRRESVSGADLEL